MYVQEQIFQIVLVLISFFDALINTGDLVGGFVAGKSTKLIPLPDHYCTDSGSESHHQHLKAALVSKIFCIHFFYSGKWRHFGHFYLGQCCAELIKRKS